MSRSRCVLHIQHWALELKCSQNYARHGRSVVESKGHTSYNCSIIRLIVLCLLSYSYNFTVDIFSFLSFFFLPQSWTCKKLKENFCIFHPKPFFLKTLKCICILLKRQRSTGHSHSLRSVASNTLVLSRSPSWVQHWELMSQEGCPANAACFLFNIAVSHFHLSDRCLDER